MKHILATFIFCMALLHGQAQTDADFSWLTGTWKGPGFGGTFEEIWSEPDANGQMMGMFRFSNEAGEIQFYEFWVLSESGLKLKHFKPDMVGWEEKDGFIDFKMVNAEPGKVTLKGLIYELMENGQLKISLDMKQGDQVTTEVFILGRVD